ncbi:hypothetical protein C8R45DRAFT_1039233, partial [Mycena sanguinolenta]
MLSAFPFLSSILWSLDISICCFVSTYAFNAWLVIFHGHEAPCVLGSPLRRWSTCARNFRFLVSHPHAALGHFFATSLSLLPMDPSSQVSLSYLGPWLGSCSGVSGSQSFPSMYIKLCVCSEFPY